MPTTLYLSHLLPEVHPGVYQQIKAACEGFGQPIDLVLGTRDIWVRDFMPIPLPDGRLLEYRYDPDYLQGATAGTRGKKSNPDLICDAMGLQTVKTDLIIDGGNVIRQGNTLIMADKVVGENRFHYGKKALKAKLMEDFQVKEVVFIPQDKKDRYGHADSMVRFIDDQTVLINYYYDDYGPVVNPLKGAGLHVKALELPGIKYTQGNYWPYLNFLQTDRLLLFTAIDPQLDAAVQQRLEQLYPAYRSKMAAIKMPEVTKKGGALNCISWSPK
ncbi:MAG: agmatine deiminase family protein [Sphingobacteriaceae bacterium]|nr:agmatine deiminase family protein [Sphingobacteriaceae bacterium]